MRRSAASGESTRRYGKSVGGEPALVIASTRERGEGAVKMLRFTARASLRGGNCAISRLLSTSIATIDTLPKNLVIDDASVLKEDSSKKK